MLHKIKLLPISVYLNIHVVAGTCNSEIQTIAVYFISIYNNFRVVLVESEKNKVIAF